MAGEVEVREGEGEGAALPRKSAGPPVWRGVSGVRTSIRARQAEKEGILGKEEEEGMGK